MPKLVLTLTDHVFDCFAEAAERAYLPTATWARVELLRVLVDEVAKPHSPYTRAEIAETLEEEHPGLVTAGHPGRLVGERLDSYHSRIRREASPEKHPGRLPGERLDAYYRRLAKETRIEARKTQWRELSDGELRGGKLLEVEGQKYCVPDWLMEERGLMHWHNERGQNIIVPKPTDEEGNVVND